ncbi:hypothetical protein [Sphingomonas phage Kimi]|nr:hypothetical protein [Sphingomonas phage Kimi]
MVANPLAMRVPRPKLGELQLKRIFILAGLARELGDRPRHAHTLARQPGFCLVGIVGFCRPFGGLTAPAPQPVNLGRAIVALTADTGQLLGQIAIIPDSRVPHVARGN